MAKSKCPVCSAPVSRAEGHAAGWRRLCSKHEDCSGSFPEASFPDDDSIIVRGKMIEENSYTEDYGDDDFSDLCEDDYAV